MNILLVFSQPWAVGGAETHVAGLAKGLVQRGHTVYLVVHRNMSPQLDGIVKKQFILDFRSKNPLNYFKLAHQVAQIVQENGIDILHAHQRTSGYAAAYAKYLTKVPFLVTIHDPWNRAYGKKIHAKIYDHIITVSEFLRTRFIGEFGFTPRKVHTIYNGADQALYNPANYDLMKIAALRQEFQIEPQDKVISLIARLYKSKGQQYLIEAALRIVERFPQARFLLVGDGPHENLLRQRIQELRLSDHFIFSGYRQDIPEMIAISDIVVRPSEMEGLPINVIEAMLMAKPVVASRIAGVPEMIEHGVNGLMVEVGDVAGLTEHILLLLANEARRVEMGLAARNTALEKFSIESCIGKTEALYLDVISQGKHGGMRSAHE